MNFSYLFTNNALGNSQPMKLTTTIESDAWAFIFTVVFYGNWNSLFSRLFNRQSETVCSNGQLGTDLRIDLPVNGGSYFDQLLLRLLQACGYWSLCCWIRCRCLATFSCCASSSSSYSASSAFNCGPDCCVTAAFSTFQQTSPLPGISVLLCHTNALESWQHEIKRKVAK